MNQGNLFIIPIYLHEEASLNNLPPNILPTILSCQALFVENEKTVRQFLKKIDKKIEIDNFEWFVIHKIELEQTNKCIQFLKDGKNVGIISEAGCAGIADPGQILISAAHKIGANIKPLVGPSSIILALMGSGLNGQQFQFNGYLPINQLERKQKIKYFENISKKNNYSQIFIETPFRNQTLLNELILTCDANTFLCLAIDLTTSFESIQTKKIADWKKNIPNIHKKLAIFIIHTY